MKSAQNTLQRYARMLPYILAERRSLALILVLTVFSAAATALSPWPLKLLVDYALGDSTPPTVLLSVVEWLPNYSLPVVLILLAAAASIGVFLLGAAFDAALTWTWSAAGQRMVYGLAGQLFARLQRLSLLYHSQRTVGDALNRLSGDTWSAYKLASDLLVAPGQHLLAIASVSILAWTLDPGLTTILLGATPLLTWSALYFGQRLKQRMLEQREVQSRLMSFVHQTLTAIPAVQAFTAQQRNRDAFGGLSRTAVERVQRNVLVKSGFNFVNGLVMALGTALVLYFGGLHVLAGTLSVGSLLVFIAYVQILKAGFGGLLKAYGNVKATEASIERVLEILDSELKVEQAPNAARLAPVSERRGRAIRFDEVSFAYVPGNPVLEDVSLDIHPGETIALVGATGAGKSTMVSLIPRFFDPTGGSLKIDGTDLRELSIDSVREQVAMVLQEPFLLPISIAENIAYGRPSADDDAIVAAARAANAEEFISQLADGYDTLVGERGATLSMGQRQRLSIARALLKDAPILVMDEPTSALDVATESQLLEALERVAKDRTAVIIAHRLSTIRSADRVVVIENGRIAECGRHEELMLADGPYRSFYSLQSVGGAA